MYCLRYFTIKNIIWQCLIKNHSVNISIIPLAKGKLSYTKELFVRQAIVFVSFRTFWKIQDKRYRQFFLLFWVIRVASETTSRLRFWRTLIVHRFSFSEKFALYFLIFALCFLVFFTVFTKNCTALSQSHSRNFSMYIIKFYNKYHLPWTISVPADWLCSCSPSREHFLLHSTWRTWLSCSSMAKKISKQIVTPEAHWFLYISIVQCSPEVLE